MANGDKELINEYDRVSLKIPGWSNDAYDWAYGSEEENSAFYSEVYDTIESMLMGEQSEVVRKLVDAGTLSPQSPQFQVIVSALANHWFEVVLSNPKINYDADIDTLRILLEGTLPRVDATGSTYSKQTRGNWLTTNKIAEGPNEGVAYGQVLNKDLFENIYNSVQQVKDIWGTNAEAGFNFTIEALFDNNKAMSAWINGLGLSPRSKELFTALAPALRSKWLEDTAPDGEQPDMGLYDYLTGVIEPKIDETARASGTIPYLDTDRTSGEVVRSLVEERFGLPYFPSKAYDTQLNAFIAEHKKAGTTSKVKVNTSKEEIRRIEQEMEARGFLLDGEVISRDTLALEVGGGVVDDEDLADYDAYLERKDILEVKIEDDSQLQDAVIWNWTGHDENGNYIGKFKTEDELAAGETWETEQDLLKTRPGKDKLVGQWGEKNFNVENGLRDSGGLLTDLGKKWMKKIQDEFDLQWEGRASGVTDWRGLITDIVTSGIIEGQFAKEDAKAAQKLADDAQEAADKEYARFARLDARGMVNEIATNMGLLTADTDPLMLNRLFGTSEASMSAMNQVRDRVATAPAGTDYKELVKEIIENIDSPQMRPDAPHGVPGAAAANQALYADLNVILAMDDANPQKQLNLKQFIIDKNLNVAIPEDGSPINEAAIIMAITGQPMDIPGIISGREEDVGRSAEEVREGVAAAGPDMAATKANVDAIAQKYGINPDEYEEGTIPEMDAALAAFDEASKPLHQQWRRDEEERIRQEYDPSYDPGGQRLAGVPPQDEGYIPPDPGAESYGGEGQLTKEEWIEKYYPGKTEGVDLFIPEGQEETYTAPGDYVDAEGNPIDARAPHRVDEEVVPVREMARFTTRTRGGARGF